MFIARVDTKGYVVEDGTQSLSPDLNPVKNLWCDIKKGAKPKVIIGHRVLFKVPN